MTKGGSMKKMISFLFALLILILLSEQANAEWAKTIRLYPYSDAHSVKQTKDGGYIILALHSHASAWKYNFWVIKLNSNSDIEWQKTYGLKNNSGEEMDDYPYEIEQTSDGGYIIVGNSGRSKTWILKIDETGNIEWQKSGNYYSPHISSGPVGPNVKQTNDGRYALTDTINRVFGHYDFGLMKLNSDGSFAWRGVYGNTEMQYLSSLQITDDGGYIISGQTIDSDDRNFSIVRIDSSGSIVWQKQYASDDLKTTDFGAIIRNTPDGGFIVGGGTQAYGNDVWVLKLDSNGNILWQKRYYDTTYGCGNQYVQDIKYTSDGNYIFVGRTVDDIHNRGKIWIVKIDSEGSILWDKAYTMSNGNLRSVRSIHETSDGGYIIGGSKMFPSSVYYDILLMKINENGDIPGCSITKEEGFTIAVEMDGKAFETNFSQRIITNLSIEDTNSSLIITNATSSYLCLPSNHIPTVNAGDDLIITSQDVSTTLINGWASDEDINDLLQYRWIEDSVVLQDWMPVGSAGECSLALNSVNISLGTHVLRLEVSDGEAINFDDMNLVIGNTAPYVALAGSGVYGLNEPIPVDASVSDYDGDGITYVWRENFDTFCSGTIESIAGGNPVDLPTCNLPDLPLGSHFITLAVSDGINSIANSIQVDVVDNTVPTLSPKINTNLLWPPNHKMVDIVIQANANDNSGGSITLSAEVSSNEPEEGLGYGDVSPDWTAIEIDQETGIIKLQLRAERSGEGNGREYTILIDATDSSNNVTSTELKVVVPHDKRTK